METTWQGRTTLLARTLAAVGAVGAVGVMAAACSSSGGAGGSGTQGTGGAGSGDGTATVETHSGPMGTFLTDSSGRTLYMWAADPSGSSKCVGTCASAWPPALATGTPTASGGAKAGDLGTITRSGGTKQLTYAGHALYRFSADTSAGDTRGQGSNGFGARWWMVAPSGQPITGSGAASSPSPTGSTSSSSSGGGGGGGWA